MRMQKENVKKLAFYLSLVILDPKHAPSITCTWNSEYLEIFLDECARNNGVPIKYKDFREVLWWDYLHKDPDYFPFVENDFKHVWNGWVQIYNYLPVLIRRADNKESTHNYFSAECLVKFFPLTDFRIVPRTQD